MPGYENGMEVAVVGSFPEDIYYSKVLAYNGDELVGRLEFSYEGNVMRIDHTYAYKEGMGVGSLLVSAANDYAINKGLRVLPVCSFAGVWYQRHQQFADILYKEGSQS